MLDEPSLPNPSMEIDDSGTEEVDEMNIIDNDSDVDSNIDVEDRIKIDFTVLSCPIRKLKTLRV